MTTIDYLVGGFREAGRLRAAARQRHRDRVTNTAQTAAKSIQRRIGDVWLSLIGVALASTAAWQYATWAGLLATAAGCMVAEKLLRIGD